MSYLLIINVNGILTFILNILTRARLTYKDRFEKNCTCDTAEKKLIYYLSMF